MTTESNKVEKVIITESPYNASKGQPPFGFYHITTVFSAGNSWTVAYIDIYDGAEFVQQVAEMFAKKYGCKVESEADK